MDLNLPPPAIAVQPEGLVRRLLEAIGADPTNPNLADTPALVAQQWRETFQGYSQDPQKVLAAFPTTANPDMAVMANLVFMSTCERHMLPFSGLIHVGYYLNHRGLHLENLPAMVRVFTHRLQNPARLADEIALALYEGTGQKGAGVLVETRMNCPSCRAWRNDGTALLTTRWHGMFCEHEIYGQFLKLVATFSPTQ